MVFSFTSKSEKDQEELVLQKSTSLGLASFSDEVQEGEKVLNDEGVLVDVVVENLEDLPEDIREIPQIVRETVPLEDDPTTPVVTFR